MTAATYTFTLSAAQSSSATMNVAMRAKPGSSIPGNASRWQGGTMPTATLTWAAGATAATTTVNTAPNSAVDGNAEYEWYKVSSNPTDLTLDTSALPTVTITDDDSSGGGGGGSTIVYGPTTTSDTGAQETGSRLHKVSTVWRGNKLIQLRVAMTGNSFLEMRQDGDRAVNFRTYSNGTAGAVTAFNNISAAPASGDVVSLEVRYFPGSTTDYEVYAVYGSYTQRVSVGSLTGTSAQGQIYYTADGNGESFTITKN